MNRTQPFHRSSIPPSEDFFFVTGHRKVLRSLELGFYSLLPSLCLLGCNVTY